MPPSRTPAPMPGRRSGSRADCWPLGGVDSRPWPRPSRRHHGGREPVARASFAWLTPPYALMPPTVAVAMPPAITTIPATRCQLTGELRSIRVGVSAVFSTEGGACTDAATGGPDVHVLDGLLDGRLARLQTGSRRRRLRRRSGRDRCTAIGSSVISSARLPRPSTAISRVSGVCSARVASTVWRPMLTRSALGSGVFPTRVPSSRTCAPLRGNVRTADPCRCAPLASRSRRGPPGVARR